MRKISIFLFVFLLLVVQFSIADDAILHAESAVIDITLGSVLEIVPRSSDYSLSSVEVKSLLYPKDSFYQRVSNFRTNPKDYTFDEGALVLEWHNPANMKLPYSISARVETDGRHIPVKRKIFFPVSTSAFSNEVREYLKPTKHIDSNHPTIVELANVLSHEIDDLYELVFNVAVWVSKNIDYNLSTISEEVSKTSSWVLENRRGVCGEMTSLFIALLRANGIPARYVSGVAYTNSPLFDFNWGAHAWAEVYFPGYGWIPFDVTYGEYGFLSPSHIELRKTADSAEASSYYGWYGRNVDIKAEMLDISPKIINMQHRVSSDFEIVLAPHSNLVGFGSYNLIEAVVKNTRNYYLPILIQMSQVNGVELHSDSSKLILLKPDESRKLYWIVSVSEDLSSRSIYTFPFSVFVQQKEVASTQFRSRSSADFFEKSELDRIIQVKEKEFERTYSNNVRLICDFEKRFFYHDESHELVCEIINLGDKILNDLELCVHETTEPNCFTLNLDIVERKEVRVLPLNRSIGVRNILVTLENDLIIKEDYISHQVLDYPFVKITGVDYPYEVSFGEEYQFKFFVEGQNVPKDLKINVALNQLSRTWRIDQLSTDREFILSLDSRDLYPAINTIVVKIVYSDDNAKIYTIIEEFDIKLVDIPFWRKLYLYPKMWLEKMIS